MRGLALKGLGTLVVFAALVPALIVLAPMAGLEPTHWSGARLRYVELPLLLRQGFDVAPEPANALLGNATTMDESAADDVAPSYWDANTDQVVLGADTNRGVALRRALGDSAGVAYRVDRRPHSARELTTMMAPLWTLGSRVARWASRRQ